MGYSLVFALSPAVSVTSAQEPTDRNREDAGRDLRKMLLTTSPAELGIRPTQDYPRVWAVAMDWPIGEHIATIFRFVTAVPVFTRPVHSGSSVVLGHESVRAAAKAFVKEADRYYDDSVSTRDSSYASMNRVRFFLVTFDGVRAVEADLGAVKDGTVNIRVFSD